ncbi:sirohydrochlorin chelatase [Pseudarthrobacter phenanthrenivorans]|uniref:Sirohydrochlorin chelatase n=1 Tax=Pseudarthrobacter phenanthrenivorans TaxID=361575 RepID=A0A3B0FZU9_PSEPS|nr:sirohydrochlorin chelatase [Pseudarthrobacter phenanthrenivorans]RKO25415.1 sirohydrochlorin chelatase [Pseudarthrobacter phenanthrenivorans]TPV51839.1 sirohydrochlorin chelatase [Pseudarthrobacter phenanthrenivorans]
MNSPIMIACAHGTSSTQGAAEVNALRDNIAALRPGLDVREAYVDVQQPDLVDVVAGLPEGESAVVVPLLLSVGYHVKVDIARAVKSRPGSAAAAPLGPDPRLAELLDQRLREAGVTDNDVIVLAAAGSSNPNAAVSVEELLGQLQELRSNRMVAAYGASAKPSVPDAVAMLREELEGGAGAGESAGAVDVGGRVVIASYLLAPGFFHDQLAKAGADVVTEPLLPSPVLAEIALDRYDAAVAKMKEKPAKAPETEASAPTASAPGEPAANAQEGGFFKAVRRFVTKYFPR